MTGISDISPEASGKYTLKNNTLLRCAKEDPRDKIDIEIGDSKQPDFKPQFKLMRWDNEVNFSLRYIDKESTSPIVETQGGVIKYKQSKAEFHAYEKKESQILTVKGVCGNKGCVEHLSGDDGCYETELILKEPPVSNVLEFSIESKDLELDYQGAYNLVSPPPEDIVAGVVTRTETQGLGKNGNVIAETPEDAAGSYAVYHKGRPTNYVGGKIYRNGKAFHIYRPKVIDKNGNWIWGKLNIDEKTKLLTITVDRSWLNNAEYPVTVDPTFGYTTQGASTFSGAPFILTYIDSPGEVGTATSISHYTFDLDNVGVEKVKYALYNNSDASLVSPQTTECDGCGASGDALVTEDFTGGGASISSQNYDISLFKRSTWTSYRDTGVGTNGRFQSITYGAWPDPATFSNTGSKYSVYCTYTAGGAGGGAPPLWPILTSNSKFASPRFN